MQVKNISKKNITNNTQKVALKLLEAGGNWVPRSALSKNVPSASARVRDLRKAEFGRFVVDCASANELNKNGTKSTFYYRIRPATVSQKQIQTVFRM